MENDYLRTKYGECCGKDDSTWSMNTEHENFMLSFMIEKTLFSVTF